MASYKPPPKSGRVILKAGREGPVRGRNPWIFSQAIERVAPASLAAGSPVEVFSASGELLGAGYYHPATTIAVRMLALGESKNLTEVLVARITDAIELRRRIVPDDTTCCRLINGDGDGLSGLVVDRYDQVLVAQFLTAGMERMRDDVIRVLVEALAPKSIVERSAGAVRREEGLADRSGLIWGDAVNEVAVREHGFGITVAPGRGQKTGYFMDQRENRRRAATFARGARVLDLYCYAAGFSIAALAAGATQVTAVDSSASALQWARQNLELNCLLSDRIILVCEDAGRFLANCQEQFDLIVVDPPPFARSRKDVPRAQRLYVEINQMAMRALAPGGAMMTFSCSQHFRGEDFLTALRTAQARAERNLRLLGRLGAAPDHPVMLGHMEGEYLTGALLTRLD
jgi:23S rRNA (cytosine1962-C5)-methyltransferase